MNFSKKEIGLIMLVSAIFGALSCLSLLLLTFPRLAKIESRVSKMEMYFEKAGNKSVNNIKTKGKNKTRKLFLRRADTSKSN